MSCKEADDGDDLTESDLRIHGRCQREAWREADRFHQPHFEVVCITSSLTEATLMVDCLTLFH